MLANEYVLSDSYNIVIANGYLLSNTYEKLHVQNM